MIHPHRRVLKYRKQLSQAAENRRVPVEQIFEAHLTTSNDHGHIAYTQPREAVMIADPHIQPHVLNQEARHARIGIVGAGIAGLNAALTLQDAGLPCSIYEASNRIGGRMHSDTMTWVDGMVSEWCGEFIDREHETIWGLIERFGLKPIDLGQETANRAQSMMYFFNRYYRAEELFEGFMEGGASEGARSAREIMQDYRRG
jgi:Flavin containing amine oxidoreductase